MAKKRKAVEPRTASSTDSGSRRASATGAIISPAVDFLCCGGLSIIAVMGFFLYALIAPVSELFSRGIELHDILALEVLINAPHFMASYRLLYHSREQVTQHRWASTYLPLILLALIVYALLTPSQDANNPEFANGLIVELFALFAVMLLAWHYTGQAWGMTASFAYIAGIRMDNTERRLIRSGYHALLVWHILWASLVSLGNPDYVLVTMVDQYATYVAIGYQYWSLVVLLTIPLGVLGFLRIRRRTGITPPVRCYTPWIAAYFWYGLILVYPGMFVFLQIFHALQYLSFPLRVEMNQYSAAKPRTGARRVAHTVAYYVVLVVVGLFVFNVPLFSHLWGDEEFVLDALAAGFVNIHHYFIDGVIWKIRNPQVRRDLFAHLLGAAAK